MKLLLEAARGLVIRITCQLNVQQGLSVAGQLATHDELLSARLIARLGREESPSHWIGASGTKYFPNWRSEVQSFGWPLPSSGFRAMRYLPCISMFPFRVVHCLIMSAIESLSVTSTVAVAFATGWPPRMAVTVTMQRPASGKWGFDRLVDLEGLRIDVLGLDKDLVGCESFAELCPQEGAFADAQANPGRFDVHRCKDRLRERVVTGACVAGFGQWIGRVAQRGEGLLDGGGLFLALVQLAGDVLHAVKEPDEPDLVPV